MLDAWKLSDTLDLPLVVVGEGPLSDEVAAAGGRVKWVGRKSRSEIYDLMQRASLLAFPSEWYEPFGLVVVEAFANGLPVVAARIGAAEELISSGRTGFLFKPGDPLYLAAAVRYAFESREALDRMGTAAALDYHSKYSPSQNVKQILGIYREAIGDRPTKRRADFARQRILQPTS